MGSPQSLRIQQLPAGFRERPQFAQGIGTAGVATREIVEGVVDAGLHRVAQRAQFEAGRVPVAPPPVTSESTETSNAKCLAFKHFPGLFTKSVDKLVQMSLKSAREARDYSRFSLLPKISS